jgi:hypothetical protein
MCRMALLPSNWKGKEAVEFLDALEKSMGGDGNGFAWRDAEGPAIMKGLEVENSALDTINATSSMVLYHTRKTSAGTMNDENTQPFFTDAANPVAPILCHNGTWTDYKDFFKIAVMTGQIAIGTYTSWSDTRFMAWLIGKHGEDSLSLTTSSVWILYYGDKAVVHVKSGSWKAFKRADGTFVYASEFPHGKTFAKVMDFKSNTIVECRLDGFTIIEGGYTNEDNTRSYSYSYSSYGEENYHGYTRNGHGFSVTKYDSKSEPKQDDLWKFDY